MSLARVPSRRSRVATPRAAGLALLLALATACAATCPPPWLTRLPADGEHVYAAASCGLLGLEIPPERVALTRATRALAEHLGIDVSRQLAVTLVEGELVVEAYGADGRTDALDGLQLHGTARCGDRVHVLVRLPR